MTPDRTSQNSIDYAGWHTVRRFLPYLWPKDRPELRWRIAGATVFVAGTAVFGAPRPGEAFRTIGAAAVT